MNVQSYWTPQKGKVNNKQNEIKQEFLFLKDPPLNLREGWVKIIRKEFLSRINRVITEDYLVQHVNITIIYNQ